MKSEVNAKQSKFKKNIPLYVLLLPSIILLILFAYIPMAGLVIAFKDYSPATGIFGSPWAGLKYFNQFFSSFQFATTMKNTLKISIYSILVGFPLADCSSHSFAPDSCGKFKKFFKYNLFASFYLDHGHVWDDYSFSLSK